MEHNLTQTRPFLIPPGQGDSVWSFNHLLTVKAAGTDTDGAFSVSEILIDKNGQPPPHVHHGEDEAWYVLEGSLTFSVGDDVFPAPAGSFVYGPRDVPHWFTVDSDEARILMVISPGGFERFFADAGQPATQPALPPPSAPDLGRILQLAGHYNCEILPPPG